MLEYYKLRQNNVIGNFCGAWTRNGFHEDGIISAVAIAKAFNVTIPWDSETKACHDPEYFKIFEENIENKK